MSPEIRFTLRLPPEVAAGERVPITLAVENLTGKTVELYLRGRTIAFDVIVRDQAGITVWQRLSGEIIPAILQLKALPAGQTLVLTAHWDQRTNRGSRVEPGSYTVRGLLLTDGDSLETPPATLTIRA